jgi:A/G-specific adenine glycosylase
MAGAEGPMLPASAAELRASLLDWYDGARRRLPWRAEPGEDPDSYRVLVSEIMLQQTTVATVQGRFSHFVERFPDLRSLASAPVDDVLHAWQGLGYYRRARALHAAARAAVERHDGALPRDVATLESLPGLGPYTAAAIAAMAFGRPAVPVDGNVARVLARLAAVELPLPSGLASLRRLASGFAATDRAGDFAQAVIELGALVCRPRAPACLTCPWRGACRAQAQGDPERFPLRGARKERPEKFSVVFLLRRGDGAILFRRRPDKEILGGMIELPSSPWTPQPLDPAAALPFAPVEADWRAVPGTVRHVFTHLALNATVLTGSIGDGESGLWCPPDQFADLALPTLTRRLLEHGAAASAAAGRPPSSAPRTESRRPASGPRRRSPPG